MIRLEMMSFNKYDPYQFCKSKKSIKKKEKKECPFHTVEEKHKSEIEQVVRRGSHIITTMFQNSSMVYSEYIFCKSIVEDAKRNVTRSLFVRDG